MAVQMYLVQPKDSSDEQARATIAEFIARRQGLILMATSRGALIVSFDDQYVDAVKAHSLVRFVGGVTLDPQRPGARKLERLFAHNAALQLASRGIASAGTMVEAPDSDPKPELSSLPPGYRPLRWPKPDEKGGE
jgi:hypothetical protein